jgi:hypothetical protein
MAAAAARLSWLAGGVAIADPEDPSPIEPAPDAGPEDRVRIEDDLEDVGADVSFTEADLPPAASPDQPSRSVTRLDTAAMTYARVGVDLVHDGVPSSVAGIDVVGEEVLAFRAHGRAEGISRFGRRIKVKVAGRVDGDFSLDANTQIAVERYEANVWDTYADLYGSFVDVRFGKQIVSWGAADLMSPNDVVNARDLRRGFLDRPDELRVPVLALSTTVYDGPLSLQGLWVPVAPTNRFELLDGDNAILGPNAPTSIERRVGAIVAALADDPMLGPGIRPITDIGATPDNGIDTSELGASLALRFARVDFFWYFLWGHERTPRIRLAPELVDTLVSTPPEMLTPEALAARVEELGTMGTPAAVADYPRRIHIGGAIATRVEPIGVKLDVGYTVSGNTVLVPPGAGPLLGEPASLPQLGVTASFDYDRGSTLTVILEGSYQQVYEVPADRAVFQLDGNRLVVVGANLRWTPRDGPLSVGLLGFVDALAPSYALRPAVQLSGHDNLSVEVAAKLLGGPVGSFGGTGDRNDEVTITVQYGL